MLFYTLFYIFARLKYYETAMIKDAHRPLKFCNFKGNIFRKKICQTVEAPVGDGRDRDGALKDVLFLVGENPECGVATVRPAPDGNPARIHDVQIVHQIFGNLDLILHLHRAQTLKHLVPVVDFKKGTIRTSDL